MKKLILLLTIIVLAVVDNGFSQTLETKKKQMEVIKVLQKNDVWKKQGKVNEFFSAHVAVGLYYYNQAVEIHNEITQNDLDHHITSSDKVKDLETRQNKLLTQALPFFENAYFIKKHDKVGNVIKDIYHVIKKENKLQDINGLKDVY